MAAEVTPLHNFNLDLKEQNFVGISFLDYPIFSNLTKPCPHHIQTWSLRTIHTRTRTRHFIIFFCQPGVYKINYNGSLPYYFMINGHFLWLIKCKVQGIARNDDMGGFLTSCKSN